MPSTSKAQRRFMGMCEHSDHPPDRCPKMTQEQFHDFASTKEKGLPYRASKKGKESLVNGYSKR
jgi:hypothetical protein